MSARVWRVCEAGWMGSGTGAEGAESGERTLTVGRARDVAAERRGILCKDRSGRKRDDKWSGSQASDQESTAIRVGGFGAYWRLLIRVWIPAHTVS